MMNSLTTGQRFISLLPSQKISAAYAIKAAIAVTVLVALPFLVTGYQSFQIATIMVYAIALLGLNLLTGYNGQVSIGHGAFFALGGYAIAILTTMVGMPFWAVIPVSAIFGFMVGFLFGFPVLRLEPLYLALATFSLALAVPQLLAYKKIAFLTGGVLGIALHKPSIPEWLPVDQDQFLYVFTLLITLIMFILARNLVKSRVGRAMMAIRDSPVAATSSGINVSIIKTITFGISVMYTTVAGSLSVLLTQYVAPDSFNLMLSISFLTGIIIGGIGSLAGAVYGAVFIFIVPTLADTVSKSAPGAVYGACLVAVVYFMPNGVNGLVVDYYRKLQKKITAFF